MAVTTGRVRRKVDGRLMQQANRAIVLDLIRNDAALSRALIARETGMSPATVSAIVDHLLSEELVREEAFAATGNLGRPPVRLAFNPGARLALGIAVDVTEISAAVVDLGGRPLETARIANPDRTDPVSVLDMAADLARTLLKHAPEARVLGAGIAVPGIVTWPEGVNLLSPNFGWRDVPVRAMMAERLGLEVRAENEVRAVALAEHHFGAAQGRHTAVFIDVGTGVGGAVIINDVLYRGEHGAAVEIGHNVVDPGGPLCGCGNRGCLEVFTSARGLVARAREALLAGRSSSLAALALEPITLACVMSAAAAGDPLACELVDRAVMYLGMAMTNAVDNWDPEVVVLGGSVIREGGSLFDDIHLFEQQHVLKTGTGAVGVSRSLLELDAKVIGAASLVISEFLAAPLLSPGA